MKVLGILAGQDFLPLEVLKTAKAKGCKTVVVSLIGAAAPGLAESADVFYDINVGQIDKILTTLKEEGVTEVVMAGKVTKELLYRNLSLDQRAMVMLMSLPNRNDDTVLLGITGEIMKEGMQVSSQTDYLSHLLPQKGVLGTLNPDDAQSADIAYGFDMAKKIAGLDIGQTIVVKKKAIMAVEAIEGTDQAVKRGGNLAGSGAVVVKVSKPKQDLRFDIPTVGMNTLQAMIDSQCSVLAIEAEKTFLVDREAFLAKADQHGIVVVAC